MAVFPAGFGWLPVSTNRSCLSAGIIWRTICSGSADDCTIRRRADFGRDCFIHQYFFHRLFDGIHFLLVVHAVIKSENGEDDKHGKREHFGKWCDSSSPRGKFFICHRLILGERERDVKQKSIIIALNLFFLIEKKYQQRTKQPIVWAQTSSVRENPTVAKLLLLPFSTIAQNQ